MCAWIPAHVSSPLKSWKLFLIIHLSRPSLKSAFLVHLIDAFLPASQLSQFFFCFQMQLVLKYGQLSFVSLVSLYLPWHLQRLGNHPQLLLCLGKCLFVPSHQKTHKEGEEKDLSHPCELITKDISEKNYEKKNSYAEVNAFSHCSCKALLQIKPYFFTLIKALIKIEKAVFVSGLSEELAPPPPLREVPPLRGSAQFLLVSFPAGGDGVRLLMAFIGVNTVREGSKKWSIILLAGMLSNSLGRVLLLAKQDSYMLSKGFEIKWKLVKQMCV